MNNSLRRRLDGVPLHVCLQLDWEWKNFLQLKHWNGFDLPVNFFQQVAHCLFVKISLTLSLARLLMTLLTASMLNLLPLLRVANLGLRNQLANQMAAFIPSCMTALPCTWTFLDVLWR